MTTLDELRLITKVSRMYYEQGLRQSDIAAQLGLSQPTISRIFKRAREEGIIRISVNVPPGVNADLEDALIRTYALRDAVVVDCITDEDDRILNQDLGRAAAYFLETCLQDGEIIGISSWSSALLAVVDAMRPVPGRQGIQVVQILGGIGNPSAEVHANRLSSRLADLLGGTAVYLPAPGVVGSEAALQVLMQDPYVQEAMAMFDKLTTALVGIGSIEPSKLITSSGNIFSEEERALLRKHGAVGDILVRFYNANGVPVQTPFAKRVVAMQLEQLRSVPRSIGVSGGRRKYEAILGALRGRWVNTLVTDRCTAERLLAEPSV